MAEREALQKQIEQLQNLIKDHKRVHGDVPSSSAPWFSSRRGLGRGRGYNPHYVQSYSRQTQPYESDPAGHWKNTYSLNKTTRAPQGGPPKYSVRKNYLPESQHVSAVTSVTDSHVGSSKLAGVSKVSLKRAAEAQTSKDSTVSLRNTAARNVSVSNDASANRTVLKPIKTKTETGIKSSLNLTESSSLTDSRQSERERKMKVNATSTHASAASTSFDPLSGETCAFNKNNSALNQVKPHISSAISTTNRTVIMGSATKDISSAQTLPSRACSILPSNIKPKSDSGAWAQAASPHKRSQFTWVKNRGTGISQPKADIHTTESSPNSASTSRTSVGDANMKQVHGAIKKVHRRATLSSGPSKTSKYSWVSSSCSTTTAAKITPAKLPNKQPSPKALKVPGKSSKEALEGMKKLACSSTASKRTKVSGGTSTPQVSHASRYRWKAASQQHSAVSCGSTPRSSRKGSMYRWTAQKEGKGAGFGPLPSQVQHSHSVSPLVNSGFKLRSRTKIIRRGGSSSPAPERRSSLCMVTVRSRYSLRRKTHTPVKMQTGARRGQARALVSFGRHKLRRLSPSAPATGPWTVRTGLSSPSIRNPMYQRVIKTRYKIDARRAHLQHHNPALSYRVKRIQSARTLLQSRLRSPPDRQWRGRGMRWIGGALYRVSANKLSRTHPTSPSFIRSGKWVSPQEVSSLCSIVKTSSTQHVASRVVQRSLAIIRQARQKKQQAKQYCMYYNRFGKCNRGDACPYIHDPDKVAVCTRFLRGTCKQTDGKCPFSHKVSKDKMPVCSYFLKGICNNSSCPYSHVYVSRKAAVCQDFIRGYCPQGEKCKKKHTLVCPEFSSTGVCPKGAKCKLQHRQRAKCGGSSLSSGPAKKARPRESAKRPETDLMKSTRAEEGTSSSGLAKLPSFISLSASPDTPETTDGPQFPTVAAAEPTGKKLHIKPRF